MCGFVGSASIDSKVDELWLRSASESISHRGPDDKSIWLSNNFHVGLAHQRLSIIDLSKNARQPLLNFSEDKVIVFNGEIYNFKSLKKFLENKGYKFNSESDTEVLLNSYDFWGCKCLSKINGMFSFAIFDIKKNKIFASRDIAGQKPFYYSLIKNNFIFGSELTTLTSNSLIKKEICLNAIDCYLTRGYSPSNKTLIKDISKLLPGYALEFNLNNGNLRTWNYWPYPENKNNSLNSYDSTICSLENNLDKAVASQLIADVPIGVCLSGGLDSSLITAFASKHLNKVSTFTAIFPEDKKYDESNYASLIANFFKTDHHQIEIKNPDINIFDKIKIFFDEPLADSSTIPTFLLYSELSKFCKVALGGDGSDELFGGYKHHYNYQKNIINNLSSKISDELLKRVFEKIPVGLKGRNFILNSYLNNLSLIPPYPFFFDLQCRKKLMSNHTNFYPIENENLCIPFNSDIEFSELSLKNDFRNYLSNDILLKTDRSSMANSLEIRSPFLDKNFIEFSINELPTNFKVNKSKRKIILNDLAKKVLPREFSFNRKQGFSVPFSKWLKNKEFKNFVYDKLISNNSFFNKEYIKSILKNQDYGFSNSERIYCLLVFELWREKLKI